MKMSSQEYFERRERAERAAAKKATCPEARRIHQELAENYADLAQKFAKVSAPQLSIVSPGDPG
jgi:hypothetical protein